MVVYQGKDWMVGGSVIIDVGGKVGYLVIYWCFDNCLVELLLCMFQCCFGYVDFCFGGSQGGGGGIQGGIDVFKVFS